MLQQPCDLRRSLRCLQDGVPNSHSICIVSQFRSDLARAVGAQKSALLQAEIVRTRILRVNLGVNLTSIPKLSIEVTRWKPEGADQVAMTGCNFGEVGIGQRKMLSNNALRVFRPPQLSDR
jgi:hypothetical protein